MLGKKTGFCKRLKEELKKELICHHCISHRLQLILRGVNYSKSNAPLCTNCVKMEKINNKIGQFIEQVLLKQYIYIYISTALVSMILKRNMSFSMLPFTIDMTMGCFVNWPIVLAASFYKKSHKKKSHLKHFCDENNFKKFVPQKTFAVR